MDNQARRKERKAHDLYAKQIGGCPGTCFVCGNTVPEFDASDQWCDDCAGALWDDDEDDLRYEDDDPDERCDYCGRMMEDCDCDDCDEYGGMDDY